jgi:hypothetical protein
MLVVTPPRLVLNCAPSAVEEIHDDAHRIFAANSYTGDGAGFASFIIHSMLGT